MEHHKPPDGVRPQELALMCGVSLRTARRWKATGRMPPGYAAGLALLNEGDLGVISQQWRGWKLLRGELVSPENWTFQPGEIVAIPFRMQQLAAHERALMQPRQFDLLTAVAK